MRRTWATLSLAILLVSLLAGRVASGQTPLGEVSDRSPPQPGGGVYRVYYDTREQLAALATHFDIWEVQPEEGYAVLALDAPSAARLRGEGYRLQLDLERTNQQVLGPPGYPCYRDVDKLYADLNQATADHPELTELIDYGDSWHKVTPGDEPGYDLWALKITNAQVQMPKPRLFLMANVHARELTTAETAMSFIAYLLDNYDNNPDVTWIVDYNEIYVVVTANPDGRRIVEDGCRQRKNANDDLGGCLHCDPWGFNHYGVDLNRNNLYQWGSASTQPCEQTYQGTAAASEPETYYLNDLIRSLFPDQRPDDDFSPTPADATGLLISLHSYSNLVLWPWGWTYTNAPNATTLQTLGRKLAYFNGYQPDQSSGLYPATGDTTDWAYGELGIPAYTFELGESFFQRCEELGQIVDENLGALLYAAKVSRTPYLTPSGPDALDLVISFAGTAPGATAHLTATIDDTRYNNSNGLEPAQTIAAAEYYIDVPPWITTTAPVAHPLTPLDGGFNAPVEAVQATLDTAGLSPARHTVFVRGQDADGNWGAFSATFLDAPTAEFTSNSPVPLGSTVVFTNRTTGTPSFGYLWDFGDGLGTSTDSDPTYLYPNTGTFTVTLVATNSLGSDSVSHPVTVVLKLYLPLMLRSP
jgi:carboxypeptidase T